MDGGGSVRSLKESYYNQAVRNLAEAARAIGSGDGEGEGEQIDMFGDAVGGG